jgi:hypothetical protein
MKKTLILIFLLLLGFTEIAFAQRKANRSSKIVSQRQKAKKAGASGGSFANSQIWLGLKGGLTFARVTPTERYSVFTNTIVTEETAKLYDKEYDTFGKNAFQFGMVFYYNFYSIFSISFQPTYSVLNAGYKTEYAWSGQANNSVTLSQKHKFQLNYLELPLLLRADLMKTRFRPFVQGGIFYGRILKAEKSVDFTSLDNASGAIDPIENTSPTIGASELFTKTNWGFGFGGGINYDLGNTRLGLEAMYKLGQNNITNQKNRFTDDRLTSIGDVLDNMKMQHLEISFSIVFPMKFLETGSFKRVTPR